MAAKGKDSHTEESTPKKCASLVYRRSALSVENATDRAKGIQQGLQLSLQLRVWA